MANWNPWHGCQKISAGCLNCYVYRIDARHGRDASVVTRNTGFDLPIRRGRGGEYKIKPGEMVYTCFSSDFFLDAADGWRQEAWDIMRQRSDLRFFFITKRIDRMADCLPADWGDGYDNVDICCTVENQQMADYRLPIYLNAPIKNKSLACEPLLSAIDLEKYLADGQIKHVVAGGESGAQARPCRYEWILGIREQCIKAGVDFSFKQTGARLIKDGRLYRVPRKLQHSQAARAGISTVYWMPGQTRKPSSSVGNQAVLDQWEGQ